MHAIVGPISIKNPISLLGDHGGATHMLETDQILAGACGKAGEDRFGFPFGHFHNFIPGGAGDIRPESAPGSEPGTPAPFIGIKDLRIFITFGKPLSAHGFPFTDGYINQSLNDIRRIRNGFRDLKRFRRGSGSGCPGGKHRAEQEKEKGNRRQRSAEGTLHGRITSQSKGIEDRIGRSSRRDGGRRFGRGRGAHGNRSDSGSGRNACRNRSTPGRGGRTHGDRRHTGRGRNAHGNRRHLRRG